MVLAGPGQAVAIAGAGARAPRSCKGSRCGGEQGIWLSTGVLHSLSSDVGTQVKPPLLRTFTGLRRGGRLCLGVRPPDLKPVEEPGKRSAEQYNPVWLLLRDHPPTCPLPLFGPRANPWLSYGNRAQKLSRSLAGDSFHVLRLCPSQLPRLGSVPCYSRCPCPQSPRQKGRGPKSLESWETPDEGQELCSPESALPGKPEAHPEFYLGQAGESWILVVEG